MGKLLDEGLTGDVVKAWKGLSKRADWVRTNKNLLKKLEKDPHLIGAVDNYYANSHKLPNNALIPPNNHNGVDYDIYGFPDFKVNQVAWPIDKVTINMGGNYSNDFTQAKNNLLAELRKTDPNAKFEDELPLRLVYKGQVSEQMTWHHMQDGQTMQLVKTSVHRGLNHAGGVKIVNIHPDLIGFFK